MQREMAALPNVTSYHISAKHLNLPPIAHYLKIPSHSIRLFGITSPRAWGASVSVEPRTTKDMN